jgi:hypothetical protein
MKREMLQLSPHQYVETGRDFNGRFWVAYSSGASMFFREVKDLRRFLKLTMKGIPIRASFDNWIASLAAADQQRTVATADGLSAEHQATGFGPECHQLDESDPNHNTKTVI